MRRKILQDIHPYEIESEKIAYYENILHNAQAAYWRWNPEKEHLRWSDGAHLLFGYKNTFPPQHQFISLVHPDDGPYLYQLFSKGFVNSEHPKVEARVRNDEGKFKWYVFLPLTETADTANTEAHFNTGLVINIHPQKQLEIELETSQYSLREAGRLFSFGSWEYNTLTQQFSWTPELSSVFETPDSYEPSLNQLSTFCEGDSRQILEEAFKNLYTQRQPFDLQLKILTYKKTPRWLRIKGEYHVRERSFPIYRGIIQDISLYKKTEEELRRKEELVMNAFLYAPIGKAILDSQKGWIYVNDALCSLLGYEEETLKKLKYDALSHPDDADREAELAQQLFRGDIAYYNLEKRWIHREGSAIHVNLNVSLIRDERQAPANIIVQVQDISQQKELTLERMKTIDALTAQNNQLSNFAHIVSHNLRSHSGNLEMLCNLYQMESDEHEKEVLVENINHVSRGLSATIQHLSEIVKVTQDINKKKELHTFREVFRNTCQVLEGQIRNSQASISGNFDLCPVLEYPSAYLESIFLNMMSNSIKYRSPDRKPVVTFRSFMKHGRPCLEVSDNGVGIDIQKHGAKIFGLYKTFHGNEDARGVGLFLIKNQVEAMGGSIEVKSQIDEGSCFTITF